MNKARFVFKKIVMPKYLYIFLLIITGVCIVEAQSDLPIGEWKSYFSYKEGTWVTQSNSKIYYVSSLGFLTINKSDIDDVQFFTREDGLSDIKIKSLYYDPFNDQVLIVYQNSNLDFFTNDGIENLPFIQTSTSILGTRNVNDVVFIDKNTALMATDFGVLGINSEAHEFAFTAFTDVVITSCAKLNDKYYVGSENGIYYVKTSGVNLSDFTSWQQIDTGKVVLSGKCSFLKEFNEKLYFINKNKVYSLDAENTISLIFTPEKSTDEITFINTGKDELMIGVRTDNYKSHIYLLDKQNQWSTIGDDCINLVSYAVQDETGRFWYADVWDPIRSQAGSSNSCNRISFNVPYSNQVGDIVFKGEKTFFSSLGYSESFFPLGSRAGFYILENGVWTNYNENNTPIFRAEDFQNIHTIEVDSKGEKVFLGSFYNGLISMDLKTNEAHHWNKENSILQEAQGDNARTRLSALKLDDKSNLWMSNYLANKPITVMNSAGEWFQYAVPSATTLGGITIDKNNVKWIAVLGVGNGILVFDENGTLDDTSDDKIRFISRNNSEITGNKINCSAVDLDGSIWVGTDEGPVVFDCGDPFDSSCKGNIRKVVVEDIPAPLLKAEDVLTIEVDGANRKWFGTRNGIFVQSPDGTNAIAKYDKKNSPLIDNTVKLLKFNATTGDMFVITDLGIQSIKTETLGSKNFFSSNVIAYPNPVRPDYNGLIAIKGLVRDANVKITDINGRLVYETTALGGQAVWDGNDYNGQRVATGIYLVFAANENVSYESMSEVTKIAVVR